MVLGSRLSFLTGVSFSGEDVAERRVHENFNVLGHTRHVGQNADIFLHVCPKN